MVGANLRVACQTMVEISRKARGAFPKVLLLSRTEAVCRLYDIGARAFTCHGKRENLANGLFPPLVFEGPEKKTALNALLERRGQVLYCDGPPVDESFSFELRGGFEGVLPVCGGAPMVSSGDLSSH